MYKYRINKITFKEGEEVNLQNLTIVVGPNNSVKSRILKDILELATKQEPNIVLLKEIDFPIPNSFEELIEAYEIKDHKDTSGNTSLRPLLPTLTGTMSMGTSIIWKDQWRENLRSKTMPNLKQYFSSTFGNYFLAYLNTEDRLRLITAYSNSGNIEIETASLLQAFYRGKSEVEQTLRSIVKESFKMDIRLDYSHLSNLYLRVGDNLENIPPDPRDALHILEKFDKIDEQGDGIKSFVATISSIIAVNRPIFMIDEPEAFLHPPQSMKLGEIIAQSATNDRQIIAVTHSSDLLRGILNKRQDIDIIRIERFNNVSKIHHLDPEDLKKVANDPLLGSSRVLDGIFYKGTVVTEGDSDSTFYQRVSRKIKLADDIHYTHAHSKQAVKKIAESYSNIGIRFSVIVDFDILRGHDEFRNLLVSMKVQSSDIQTLKKLQEEITKEIESVNKSELLDILDTKLELLKVNTASQASSMGPDKALENARRELKRIRDEDSSVWGKYKASGRSELTPESKTRFIELDKICRQCGIFIVPVGDLESWMIEYGVIRTSNKPKWIVEALKKLHEIEIDDSSLVGKFITDIHNYLVTPT